MGSIVGGGSGGFLSAIGSIVGGIFGGPVGAMLGQAIGGMVQNLLGQAMQNSGVDQSTQDSANEAYNSAFQEASGGLQPSDNNGATPSEQINQFADAAGASDADRGSLQRTAADLQQSINDFVAHGAADAAGSSETESKGGGSWLMAIAKALGSAAGKQASNLVKLSNELVAASDKKNELAQAAGDKPSASQQADQQAAADDYNNKMTQFQAASQEFSMFMNVISTSIKSLGDGLTTVARKQ